MAAGKDPPDKDEEPLRAIDLKGIGLNVELKEQCVSMPSFSSFPAHLLGSSTESDHYNPQRDSKTDGIMLHTHKLHRSHTHRSHTRKSHTRKSHTRKSNTRKSHTHKLHTHKLHTHKSHTHKSHTHKDHRNTLGDVYKPDNACQDLYYYDLKGDAKNLTNHRTNTLKIPEFELDIDIMYHNSQPYKLKRDKRAQFLTFYAFKVKERLGSNKETRKRKEESLYEFMMRSKRKYVLRVANFESRTVNSQSNELELRTVNGQPFGSSFIKLGGDEFVKEFAKEGGDSCSERYLILCEELNRKIDENPQDICLWRRLVDAQAGLFKNAEKESARKAISGKRQAIYKKALSLNKNNVDLVIEYLNSCVYEDFKEVLELWESYLRKFPSDLKLRLHYLQFRQTNYPSFTVGSYMEEFEECVRIYKSSVDCVNDKHNQERIILCALSKACKMLMEAGYSEKCIAVYQAMFEINFLCPQAYANLPFDKKVEFFENFWDSAAPKFGNKGSRGWRNSLFDLQPASQSPESENCPRDTHTGSKVDEESSANLDGSTKVNRSNPLEVWEVEHRLQEEHWLPRSIADMGIAEGDHLLDDALTNKTSLTDPFMYVVFEDISKCLFPISTPEKLLLDFLNVLGFAVSFSSSEKCYASDQFLFPSFSDLDFSWTRKNEDMDVVKDEVKNVENDVKNVKNELLKTVEGTQERAQIRDTLKHPSVFTQPGAIFRALPYWPLQQVKRTKKVPFVRRILDQAADIVPKSFLPKLLMCGALAGAEKSFAKKLLQANSDDLGLWEAFALSELRKNDASSARKTCILAINARPCARAIPLYRILADVCFLLGQVSELMCVLCSMQELGKVNLSKREPVTRVLRAQKALDAAILSFLEKAPSGAPIAQAACTPAYLRHILRVRAVMEIARGNVFGAISVYTKVLQSKELLDCDKEAPNNPAEPYFSELEKIYEDYAMALYENMKNSFMYTRRDLSLLLEEFLDAFPYNTLGLSLLSWNEQRAKMYNKLKRHLESTAKPNPVTFFFAIWSEVHCTTVPNANYVRHLFSKAAENEGFAENFWAKEMKRSRKWADVRKWVDLNSFSSDFASSSCAALSALHVQFEVRAGNLEKAKSAFYASINRCPWSKELYMIAFRLLNSHLTQQETDQLQSIMELREICIRNPAIAR